MNIKTFILFFAIIRTSKGCFKAPKPQQKRGVFKPFDDHDHPRKLADHHCLCGINYAGQIDEDDKDTKNTGSAIEQRWILYIRVKINSSKTRECVGTIINSNMVITSHRCLQKKNRITVQDVLRSHVDHGVTNNREGSSLASVTDIRVFSQRYYPEANFSEQNFTVKKIIYSERFAYDSVYEKAPESDIAILVLDYDFTRQTNDSKLHPICLPRYGQLNTKDLLNLEGYYQGSRDFGLNDSTPTAVQNFSIIKSAEDCNNGGNLGVKPTSNDTLCLMFTQPGPTVEGGPIRINVKRLLEGGPIRSFLVGIATWVERTTKNAGHNYAYFANINTIAKYIEHHAELQDSTWCPTPNPDDKYWPWEGYTGEVAGTLDCQCGFQKEEAPAGRITGGQTAVYNEFPWLVKFNVTINKTLGNESALCGGSVINDRMILTAAHCFVRTDILKSAHEESWDFNIASAPGRPGFHGIFLHSFHYKVGDDEKNNISFYRVYAKQIIFHPGFPDQQREHNLDYDIALVILAEPLTLGRKTTKHLRIDPICLPKKGYLKGIIGQNATIAGWGLTSLGLSSEFAVDLKKLNLPIRSPQQCAEEDLNLELYNNFQTDTKFCASWFDQSENIQSGDSGSPLMHATGKNKFTQIGICSFNVLTNPATNSYFASVEAFLPFINYYSKENDAQFCKN